MQEKPSSDLNALAIETLDLWQEHLAALAADPKAKQDLAQLMEPSRRLFAEWIEKAQTTPYGTASFAQAKPATTDGPASAGLASDDGSLRLAQLALHVAELEKRVARLESGPRRAARKNPDAAKK